jgi:hypothetical protein
MEINNILIQDTNGDLAEDLFKNHPDQEALSVWFETVGKDKILNFSTNNIRYESVPNINGSTYKTFLTYNGTLDLNDRLFSLVVAEDNGIFRTDSVPVLQYNPKKASSFSDIPADRLDNVLIDIKMYNGTVSVITYEDGMLSNGTNGPYKVKSERHFPTRITKLPNVECERVYLDGWYSYTQIIFRDIQDGDRVVAGNFYGKDGFIFKASNDGRIYKQTNGDIYIVLDGQSLSEAVLQVENSDYKELLFSLEETTGISPESNHVYLHSQVLVLDEIRNAMLAEIIEVSCKDKIGCDFMDWQKLSLKRTAAYIMFENGLFEKAQVIIESARSMCTNTNYSSIC